MFKQITPEFAINDHVIKFPEHFREKNSNRNKSQFSTLRVGKYIT